jgi:hypothetical protein
MVKRTVLCVCRFHRRDEGKTHHVLFIYLCVYLFIYAVLGMEFRFLFMLGKHSITEQHPQLPVSF